MGEAASLGEGAEAGSWTGSAGGSPGIAEAVGAVAVASAGPLSAGRPSAVAGAAEASTGATAAAGSGIVCAGAATGWAGDLAVGPGAVEASTDAGASVGLGVWCAGPAVGNPMAMGPGQPPAMFARTRANRAPLGGPLGSGHGFAPADTLRRADCGMALAAGAPACRGAALKGTACDTVFLVGG